MRYLVIFLLFSPLLLLAHGGDDHAEKKPQTGAVVTYFSAETNSDKYELLLKYEEIEPGKEASLKLFVSNYLSNAAIDGTIKVNIPGNDQIKLEVVKLEKGIYLIKGIFPNKQSYNLAISINSELGPDLLQLSKIEIGKALPVAETAEAEHSHWYESPWLFGAIGLIVGLSAMFLLLRNRKPGMATIVILVCILIPVSTLQDLRAHGGGHEEGGKGAAAMSTSFVIEKETQFLFNILTEQVETSDFKETVPLFGTVTGSPEGRAVIQTPQSGIIVNLKVRPGDQVKKGQALAVVEQAIDAGTQIDISSQRNQSEAEFQAAKSQYDRLKAIEDIAAKKDVTEAKARFETASKNRQLLESNNGSSGSKLITLTSPIEGTVGTFNYAIGAVVNSGETLFEVTNLSKVYVEAQVFREDENKLRKVSSYTIFNLQDSTESQLRLLSASQTVNSENQAGRMVFEVINPKNSLRIGENITVQASLSGNSRNVNIPNEAITEVNGKQAIFIKDKAENISISFIVKGAGNGKNTVIIRGTEEGEKVIVSNVYQVKTIYLNQ